MTAHQADELSAARLIAAHMNAPYGQIVSAADVVASLKSGHFAASTKEANGILEALFTEISPDLIMKCAEQIQAPLEMVNRLYHASLSLGIMRSQEWEDSTSSVMAMTHRAELRARYPAILAHASLRYGPGWAGIMEALCERLQFHADHNNMPPVEITQAKEKWGELSVNYAGGDTYADGLIDMAEALSAHVCEVCGNPGTLQEGPAFRTRCAAHTGQPIP